MYAVVSNIIIKNSAFIAHDKGGAIFTGASTLSIKDSVFSQNRAGRSGGAISAHLNSIVSISGSEVLNGRGKSYSNCMMNNVRSRISPQVSTTMNMLIHSTIMTLSGPGTACFHSNEAGASGGALSISDSNITFSGNVFFDNNSATTDGGALMLRNANMNAQNLICMNNSALGMGGAVHATESTLHFGTTVEGTMNSGVTLFYKNRASSGGAISIVLWVTLILSGSSIFLKNEAHQHGGGAIKSSITSTIILPNGKIIFEQIQQQMMVED